MYATITNNTIDKYPLSFMDIRKMFPNVSFGANTSNEDLLQFNVVKVLTGTQPSYDPMTQELSLSDPINVEGNWIEQWQINQRSPEEISNQRSGLTCTPRQARLALQQAGLLTAVTDWISSADNTTQIEWEFALEIRRDWPPITLCATYLGLSEEQLDDLFILAATL